MMAFLIYLITLLLACWLLYCVLAFMFFWYEAVNSEQWRKIETKYQVSPWVFMVRSVSSSVFSLARVWFFGPLRLYKRFWELPDTLPEHTPIVFVHGYLHDRSAWFCYFRWFRKRGYTHLCAIDLKGKFFAIERYAKQLQNAVDHITKTYNVAEVDIVAHSMGGIVSRYYLQKLDGCKKVRKLVTLATPHKGTKLAVFMVGKAREELLAGSAFMSELDVSGRNSLRDVAVTAYYSESDFMILPTELAKIDDMSVKNISVGLVSHIEFLYKKDIWARVLGVLSSE